MTPLMLGLVAVSVIGCALVAGVFLTFSEFVMRALDRTTRSGTVEAMQIINREVFRTLFMVLLIGMSVLAPVLIALAWWHPVAGSTLWVTLGGAIYLVTVFAVTLRGNVPLNIALDKLDWRTPEAARFWNERFYPRWMLWNHVRTAGAAAAAVCYLAALLYPQLA